MPTEHGHTTAIRAKKVLGTAVNDQAGDKIGHIEDIVLDKTSNDILFAVVSFGGFLGMGEKFHAIPWSGLTYNTDSDAYVVAYSRDQLETAPADEISELIRNDGADYRAKSYEYYGVSRDW